MEEFKSMDRRKFVKKTSLGLLALPLISNTTWSLRSEKKKKITILHTNDMHSHIDPFYKNDKKYAGMGGMRRLGGLIQEIRAQEKNILLLDSGDIFQGTPYFNKYKGEVEFKIMSNLGYDASTMGNHDFDNGIEGFKKMLPHSNFPFLCSNYDFTNTILHGETKTHLVKEIDGIKVGLLGVGIELNGLVEKSQFKETKYLDPIEQANYYAKKLKEDYRCDLIICLSHLGYSYNSGKISDLVLASKSENINIILGGHTHTFLKEATKVTNKINQTVLVNQAGWGALSLGRIDIEFTKKGNKNNELSAIDFLKKNYAKI